MTSTHPTPATHTTVLLVPGFWLGAWAWDDVAAELRTRGFRVHAITLPGLDPADEHRRARTLADQVAALRDAAASARVVSDTVLLAVHSGAGAPASALLDLDPTAVDRVVYVDSGPSSPGGAHNADFSAEHAEWPLPPFAELQASLDGLSEAQLTEFRRRSVPEPAAVVRAAVSLENPARRAVPSTVIACSFSAAELWGLARSGHPMMAELAQLEDVQVVDLPTGHWPMWSRPSELAELIARAGESRG